jgi:hypothetical protein
MSEKPLKVQVAEALGGEVSGEAPYWNVRWPGQAVPEKMQAFDTDERLCLRIMTRFGIEVKPGHEHLFWENKGRSGWWAFLTPSSGWGVTIPHAVCYLLLALHTAGYLPALIAAGGPTP